MRMVPAAGRLGLPDGTSGVQRLDGGGHGSSGAGPAGRQGFRCCSVSAARHGRLPSAAMQRSGCPGRRWLTELRASLEGAAARLLQPVPSMFGVVAVSEHLLRLLLVYCCHRPSPAGRYAARLPAHHPLRGRPVCHTCGTLVSSHHPSQAHFIHYWTRWQVLAGPVGQRRGAGRADVEARRDPPAARWRELPNGYVAAVAAYILSHPIRVVRYRT